MIRKLEESDAVAVLDIYQQGLDTGEASFETSAPDWGTWNEKYHPFCRLLAEQDDKHTGMGGAGTGFTTGLLSRGG